MAGGKISAKITLAMQEKPLYVLGLLALSQLGLGQIAWSIPGDFQRVVRMGSDELVRCQRRIGSQFLLEAYDSSGAKKWTYALPGFAKDIRPMPDGRTYACGSDGLSRGFVKCLSANGTEEWGFLHNPNAAEPEEFSVLRVSGVDVWAVGQESKARKGGGAVRKLPVCVRLNRFSGSPAFVRTYSGEIDADEIVAGLARTTGWLYVLASGSSWNRVLKVHPGTGDLVGSSFQAGGASEIVVDSLDQAYISMASPDQRLSKIDCSGAGALPIVWSGVAGGDHLRLAKGKLWCLSNSKGWMSSCILRRVTPNGVAASVYISTLSGGPVAESQSFSDLFYDSFGRLFLQHDMSAYWDPQTFAYTSTNVLLDASSGQVISSEFAQEMGVQSFETVVDRFGNAYTTGNTYLGPRLTSHFRQPQPRPDNFATMPGKVLNVTAPGLMANDLDVDPKRCKTYIAAQATNGVVVVNSNGSFRYTPSSGFQGMDSFRYRVTRLGANGTSVSGFGTVTVQVDASP